MAGLKFNSEISISHIFLGVALVLSAFTWKASVESGIASEAHVREVSDLKLSASVATLSNQMASTTALLKEMQAAQRLNSDHRLLGEGREAASEAKK